MKKMYTAIGVGILVLAGLIAGLILMVSKVENGHVGVIYSINGGVQEEVLGQGWHLVYPTERVIEYPVRTQNKNYESLAVATIDGKTINMPVSLNYHVDSEKASAVYKKFGNITIEDLEEGYIKTRINDALRQTISEYTVIQAFGERIGDIKLQTIEVAKADLEKDGIIIEDIMLSAPQPDAETQKAIDDRVKATQELERKKTDKLIATEEAERKRIEAEGEAEANRVIQESLSEEVLMQQLIEKWSGTQPISIGGDGVMIDLPQPQPEEKTEEE